MISRQQLISWALGCLKELGFESSRYWEVTSNDTEQVLECKDQRDSAEAGDLLSLIGRTIAQSDAASRISWWSVQQKKLTYVSNDEDLVRQLFACEGKNLEVPARLPGSEQIDFLYYEGQASLSIYKNNSPHSWLDLPLIEGDSCFGKISVSHPRSGQPFSREDCEVAGIFTSILNQHVARIHALEAHGLRAMAMMSHELRQPTELATHSVQFLRARLIREKNQDLHKEFTLRNLEHALALIHNLNDAQNLALSSDSRSSTRIDFSDDVIRPIVNMIRHRLYMELLADRQVELSSEHLDELNSYDQEYRWKFKHQHIVRFECPLSGLKFYLRKARLQEICHNLLTNAVKYRKSDQGVEINIQLADRADESFPAQRDFEDYHVIQFVDYGLGIEDDEKERIFLSGETGSASEEAGEAGNGIGLSIARQIARGFKGDLIIGRLRNPTRFDLLVPVATTEQGWWES